MQEIFKLINKYDSICIFHHEFGDPDALGSSFGLAKIIEDNFKEKKVYILGKNVNGLNGVLFPDHNIVDDEIIKNSLAIILDTANTARIDDQRFSQARYIIKIDHHPTIDDYADYNYVDTNACATAYIIAGLSYENELKLTDIAATYLYAGIVGDTGRFFHNNTTAQVFKMVTYLCEAGADIQYVYKNMYTRTIPELKLSGYILENFEIIDDKIAYYVLEEKDYLKYNVPFDKAKEYVNTIAGIEGINIWVSCIYNNVTGFYHVSIRSKGLAINQVAEEFKGGGHAYAAGVKVKTIERFHEILSALQKLT